METQRKVKDAIQLNDWAFSLDLTRLFAYPDTLSVLQIPQIHVQRSSVPVQGTPIRPLDKSCRVYTPYGGHRDFPKEKGDNSTSLSRRLAWAKPNRRRLLEHRQFILSLINSQGLIINYEKSDLVPAQVFTFIGMEFLTHTNIVRVPQSRQMKILKQSKCFHRKPLYQPEISCLSWDN